MMIALVRSLKFAALAAVTLIGFTTGSASAGPIGAASSPEAPPLLSSITPGTGVPNEHLVVSQYQSSGLSSSIFQDISLAALGSIGSTTAFVPTLSTAKGHVVDYTTFVGFQIVNPTTGLFSTTNHVSVEFVGPRAFNGFLYAMTPEGAILGSTVADDGIGPNGGYLATLNLEGVGIIAMWSMFDPPEGEDSETSLDRTWGIASVSINKDATPPPSEPGTPETPEPATLAIALAGLVGAAGAGWKRRRGLRS
jgi:hypothetical protein